MHKLYYFWKSPIFLKNKVHAMAKNLNKALKLHYLV
jgi:hypothetical protein